MDIDLRTGIADWSAVLFFGVDPCRDSLCFRGNCLKIYGADRPFWRPKEPLGNLIAPRLHPD